MLSEVVIKTVLTRPAEPTQGRPEREPCLQILRCLFATDALPVDTLDRFGKPLPVAQGAENAKSLGIEALEIHRIVCAMHRQKNSRRFRKRALTGPSTVRVACDGVANDVVLALLAANREQHLVNRILQF